MCSDHVTCRKIEVLSSIDIRLKPREEEGAWAKQSPEERSALLDKWYAQTMAYLNEHRWMDQLDMTVSMEKSQMCSNCGALWHETDFEGCVDFPHCKGCSNCGAPLA